MTLEKREDCLIITSLPVEERIIYFLRPGIAVSLPESG